MATHSSVLVWRIPGMGEPGGLPSIVSHRVGHDWSDVAAAAAGIQHNCGVGKLGFQAHFSAFCCSLWGWLPLQSINCSVVSDSMQPHRLWPVRLLCPWNSPSKNTGVGCYSLLQGVFPIQGLKPISLIVGRFFTIWTTKEAHCKRVWFKLLLWKVIHKLFQTRYHWLTTE